MSRLTLPPRLPPRGAVATPSRVDRAPAGRPTFGRSHKSRDAPLVGRAAEIPCAVSSTGALAVRGKNVVERAAGSAIGTRRLVSATQVRIAMQRIVDTFALNAKPHSNQGVAETHFTSDTRKRYPTTRIPPGWQARQRRGLAGGPHVTSGDEPSVPSNRMKKTPRSVSGARGWRFPATG
jgi:hypothetical protein